MIWIFYIGVFAFGLAAGSFLNVCIYRLPAGKSLVKPGSTCPKCGNAIRFYDNIPLLSWLILRGKCRNCKEAISMQYPLVELLTGLLLLWLTYDFMHAGKPVYILAVYIYLTLGLIALSFVDRKHEIIPDEISLMGIPVALVLSVILPGLHSDVPFFPSLLPKAPAAVQAGISSVAGMLIGGGALWLVGIVAKALLKKEAMGFGDVKLMAMVGGLLGWLNALLIFFIACGIGSVIGIIVLIKTRNRRIPFGPFLAGSTYLIMLYGPELIYFFTDVYPVWIRKVLGIG